MCPGDIENMFPVKMQGADRTHTQTSFNVPCPYFYILHLWHVLQLSANNIFTLNKVLNDVFKICASVTLLLLKIICFIKVC